MEYQILTTKIYTWSVVYLVKVWCRSNSDGGLITRRHSSNFLHRFAMQIGIVSIKNIYSMEYFTSIMSWLLWFNPCQSFIIIMYFLLSSYLATISTTYRSTRRGIVILHFSYMPPNKIGFYLSGARIYCQPVLCWSRKLYLNNLVWAQEIIYYPLCHMAK